MKKINNENQLKIELQKSLMENSELNARYSRMSELIKNIAILLGVFETDRDGRDMSYHQKILKALVDLKVEYAREDEGSALESEKASMIESLFKASLQDRTTIIEAEAKMEFLKILTNAKDIRLLMDIAHNYGVYPKNCGGINTLGGPM